MSKYHNQHQNKNDQLRTIAGDMCGGFVPLSIARIRAYMACLLVA